MRQFKLEEKEFSEINITPFTDVVLVLLIIFMIASPFLMTGAIDVKLPESSQAENAPSNVVEVYLNEFNEIYIGESRVTYELLTEFLQREFLIQNSQDVIVKADEKAVHGNVIKLLDALTNAGAKKLIIATTPKDE
ncbi:MAG: hypothetical protein C0425_09375 [Chlorobiaceae bacterium]|nr:hypothetical protein [Chlorobiaceae bacterium]